MIVAVFFVSWPEEGDFQHRSTSAQEEGEGNPQQTTSNKNIIAYEILKKLTLPRESCDREVSYE